MSCMLTKKQKIFSIEKIKPERVCEFLPGVSFLSYNCCIISAILFLMFTKLTVLHTVDPSKAENALRHILNGWLTLTFFYVIKS